MKSTGINSEAIKNSCRLLAVPLIFTLLTTSCASYRNQVSNDFRDTVKINVGVGFGFYAHAKATSFLDGGLGWGGYWAEAGLEDRYTHFFREGGNGCPFPIGLIPKSIPDVPYLSILRMYNIRITERFNTNEEYCAVGQLFDWKAVSKWDAYSVEKKSPYQIGEPDEPEYTEHPCGFEAGLGIIFFKADVGFDPVEFGDLICSVFGFNLLHDKPKVTRQNQSTSYHTNSIVHSLNNEH